jgi:hypothetical protein
VSAARVPVLDPAVAHPDNTVRPGRDLWVMGHQDDRLALLVQPREQRHHRLGGFGVQVAGGLVRPHDRRPVHQRTGYSDTLLLAAGKPIGPVAGPTCQPHHLQRLDRPGPGPPAAHPLQHQRQLDVLHRAEHRKQVERLEHKPHAPAPVLGPLVVPEPRQVGPLHPDLATVDLFQPGQAVQQRRLA